MRDLRNYLILTDLDGTFFGKKSELVPRNMEAVERFKAAGGTFTVASGRMHTNMTTPIPNIREVVNAPMICCNGALLYDIRTDRTMAEKPMPREAGGAFLSYLFEKYPQASIRASTAFGFLIDPENLKVSPMLQRDVASCAPGKFRLADRSEWGGYVWYKLVIRGESDWLDKLRQDVEAHGFPELEFSKSGATFFEAQARGTNKSAMMPELRAWVEKEKGHPVRIFACGDYENDLAMLKAADAAVCPVNALADVKDIADYCLCHNTEGLIGDLIERMERGEIQ